MAIHLEYRKTGADTWLLATFDLVGTHTIEDLDPVEYQLRAYDTATGLHSQIITEIANGGIIVAGDPSSLVTNADDLGVAITDNSIYPKNGSTDIPFSIEMWVKPMSFASTFALPAFIDDGNGNSLINCTLTASNTLRFSIQIDSSNRISMTTGANALTLNKWNQIVLTYDGSKLNTGLGIRINRIAASLFNSNLGTYTGLPSLTGNFVAQLPVPHSNPALRFIGKLDRFRFFYNKVLSEAEVIELDNEMRSGPVEGLAFANTCVLEHRFDNSLASHIGQNAVALGTPVYDSDLPWAVPINEINFYSFTSFESVMWSRMMKSSDWPELTTTKPYFVLYCTDHSTLGGGIAWGECDDVYFNGFVERGIITSNYQAETPWLIRVPTSTSGLTDTIFLYYHTVTGEPGNDGKQQTRLMTTTGGLLHAAVWTDRGRPLGIYNDDNHTGYARFWIRDDGTMVSRHATTAGATPTGAISESADGLTYTRLLDTTNHTVDGYEYGHINLFERNGLKYGIVRLTVEGGYKIGIVTLDNNFSPLAVVDIMPNFYTFQIVMAFVEGNTAYINIKPSTPEYRNRKTYMVEYDLTQLDA